MRNYPYLWFSNIVRLLEKRDYNVVTIFLFALFVGSFRRFLEWVLGGVPEPFPLSFIVTLTGFYWFAFFIITLILKVLVKQPWQTSMNVILVGIFLGIFPPLLDLLFSGPGFQYGYVWSLPSKFNWFIYNPELKIPIGEAIVLWAVILLTATYVWHKTRNVRRALLALFFSYIAVLVLGGVLAGVSKLLAQVLGWQPTQQITLLNVMQILAAYGIYALMQPRVTFFLAMRTFRWIPYWFVYWMGAWAAGGLSVTVVGYAVLLTAFLAIADVQHIAVQKPGESPVGKQDVLFFMITGGLLLAALAAGNALVLLPLALLFLTGTLSQFVLAGRSQEVRNLIRRGSWAFCAFAAGATAALEHAGYGGPRWWIAFLPPANSLQIVKGFDALTLMLLAAVTAGFGFSAILSRGKGQAATQLGSQPAQYAVFSVFVAVAAVACGRTFLDWTVAGEYPTLMLVSLLVVGGRYWLAFFLLCAALQALTGRPWREHARAGLLLPFVFLFPPIADALGGRGPVLYTMAWSWPEAWNPLLAYPVQGITGGEAAAWWSVIAIVTVYVWKKTARVGATAAALLVSYVAASVVSLVPLVLAEQLRTLLAWPEEHRIALLAIGNVVAAFGAYLACAPSLARGLARRLPHVLPFVLICVLGSAFYGAISPATWAYALFLGIAGWLALGQNDYFDAAEDAAQGRLAYLDLEDARFLTLIAWLGVACLAASHAGVTFLAVMAAVTYMLYNYPFYRGKRYFPTNLKIEGIWGFCAFGFGVIAAYENAAYGAPRWWVTSSPPIEDTALRGPFDVTTIAAMFLAFGGFSLVALLKDYKDWEADQAAGVGTLYTVALSRGWNFKRVHRIALATCSLAVASAPVLLAAAGKIAWPFAPAGLLAGALVWVLMSGPASAARFRLTLLMLAVYFLFLIFALGI